MPKCASGLTDSAHSCIFSVASLVPEIQAKVYTRYVRSRVVGSSHPKNLENFSQHFGYFWTVMDVIRAKSGFSGQFIGHPSPFFNQISHGRGLVILGKIN